jgi:hypothetical protein
MMIVLWHVVFYGEHLFPIYTFYKVGLRCSPLFEYKLSIPQHKHVLSIWKLKRKWRFSNWKKERLTFEFDWTKMPFFSPCFPRVFSSVNTSESNRKLFGLSHRTFHFSSGNIDLFSIENNMSQHDHHTIDFNKMFSELKSTSEKTTWINLKKMILIKI